MINKERNNKYCEEVLVKPNVELETMGSLSESYLPSSKFSGYGSLDTPGKIPTDPRR